MTERTSSPHAPDDPGLLAALARVARDDDRGSAAVEFIVLVPVYILLLAGLFTLGEAAMCRQALVAAARFEAWSANDVGDDQIEGFFFAPYRGKYRETAARDEREVTWDEGDLSLRDDWSERGRTGPIGDEGGALGYAAAALNNAVSHDGRGGEPTLRRVHVQAEHESTSLVGAVVFTQRTQAAVVLTAASGRESERPEFQEGRQDHPINHLDGAPFDPSSSENRYLSPEVLSGGFFDGGRDPGIWSSEARIFGSVWGEWGFYQGQSKP